VDNISLDQLGLKYRYFNNLNNMEKNLLNIEEKIILKFESLVNHNWEHKAPE